MQFNYLGWGLLPALVLCCFDGFGDCGHTIQVLWGQRPSCCQEEDGGWALRSATSPSQGHLRPQHRGAWRPGPREGIHSGHPSPLCLPPSHTVPSAWDQTPHMKRLLKVGGIWLCLYRRAWLSGTSSANEESFIVL